MATNGKIYRLEVHEEHMFGVLVSATSEADAVEKVKAFYKAHRKPEKKYVGGGVIAILLGGGAKARPPARDSHRDAAPTV